MIPAPVFYSSEFYIDDSPELNSWELKQRARRLASHLKAQEKKLGLIIVDYLQLMTEASRMEKSTGGGGEYLPGPQGHCEGTGCLCFSRFTDESFGRTKRERP